VSFYLHRLLPWLGFEPGTLASVSTNIHTYISARFRQEHRPSTKSLHRTRLLAWASSSPKDFLPHSFKTVRLQVALGHPLDLFPCGFHSKALWQISFSLFRRVWEISTNSRCKIYWTSLSNLAPKLKLAEIWSLWRPVRLAGFQNLSLRDRIWVMGSN
jgi:hypothetical protein